MAARPLVRSAFGPTRLCRSLHPPRSTLGLSVRRLATSEASGAEKKTHFGFETVSESEKTERVSGVFTSVAESYDRMNDLMSFGWHRVWKCVPRRRASRGCR